MISLRTGCANALMISSMSGAGCFAIVIVCRVIPFLYSLQQSLHRVHSMHHGARSTPYDRFNFTFEMALLDARPLFRIFANYISLKIEIQIGSSGLWITATNSAVPCGRERKSALHGLSQNLRPSEITDGMRPPRLPPMTRFAGRKTSRHPLHRLR